MTMTFEKSTRVPPDGLPIIPWFDGVFSRAFIVLHPFVAIEGLDPASCEPGNHNLNAGGKPEGLGLIEWADRERSARLRGKELRFGTVQDIAKGFGQPIRWGTICRELDLADNRSIDRALRTQIGSLKQQFSDHTTAENLINHCARSKIFLPTEGSFQPILEPPLAVLLRRLGLTDVTLGDEFGEDAYPVSVDELEAGESWSKAQPRRIVASDRSLVVLTPWDSFFTIILGSSERLISVLPDLFEGFWCSNETTTDWCFEPYIPLVG